jgi:hypothetical protein
MAQGVVQGRELFSSPYRDPIRDSAPLASPLAAIPTASEAAGVEFIAENGGGAGVRLKLGPKD